MDSAPNVIRLPSTQAVSAGEILARAFFHDPLATYMFPDPMARARLLPWHYGTLIRYGMLAGDVYGTPDCAGVAAWLLEGDGDDDKLEWLEQSGMMEAPVMLGAEAFSRFATVHGHLEALRRRDMPPRHWYLPILGVDPSQQGRGLGGRLLQPILARADAEGIACYLETFQQANLPFYRRHAFEPVVEDVHAGSSLRFWTFKREPQPAIRG